MTQDMINKIILEENIFPRWEQNIPTVGTKYSHGGNKMGLRLLVTLLLMMVVGVSNAWGQVGTDYSGTYCIASDYQTPNSNPAERNYDLTILTNNFYLCPTEEWISFCSPGNKKDTWTTGDGKPFLTTYKARLHATDVNDPYDITKAKWTIEYYTTVSNKDYYYFKHSSGKYLVLNKEIDGMKGNSPGNRIRVHLETLTSEQLEAKGDSTLFTITQDGRSIYICPKPQTSIHLTVNNGNGEDLKGNGTAKGYITYNSTTYGMEGTIGIYANYSTDDTKYFYLEDYITRPTITYNEANDEITITAVQLGVDLIYTTDGSTPSTTNPNAITITGTEGNTTSVTFNPADGATTIKAVVVENNELSNISKFTTPVFFGSNHKYLIQSQNNGWTIDENTTDFHFYMIPGDEDNSVIKVNTTSLFRPTMEWYFLNAGVENDVQYYYIVNNSAKDNSNNPYYLCWDGTYVCMLAYDSNNADKFKFKIGESPTAGTFNIVPYGLTSGNIFITKGSENANAAVVTLGNSNSGNSARWKFIVSSTLDRTPPFTVSNTSVTRYYQLANVGSSGYYIVPPTGNNTAVTTSNSSTDADVMRGSWYLEEAQAATASDWCTYYHIRNAETGKYLYFTKDANDAGACLEMRDAIESGNEERYKFTWARTATENTYYIIPKLVKDASQNQFSTLRRDGGTLKSNLTRGAGNYAWTFGTSTFHCTAPEITYDDSNNQIEISSPQGVGIYYTTNGVNDDVIPSSSTHYTQSLEIGSTTQIIRAVCARSGDGTDNSNVVKIILNPDITLSDASVTYDGSGHQPTISSVEYNSTIITSECTFAKYLDEDGNVVSECVNAGEYKVVITDAEGGDYYVYGSTTFTINPASLTITPNDGQSKEYGDPDPELTYTSSGLLTGDELTGALSRDEGEVVGGTYYITQGTLGNPNYTASFTTGKTFTITAKSLGSGSTPAPNITCDVTETGGTHSIVVKQCGNDLTLGTDYTKDHESDGAKYYDVTVAGTGNYTGGFNVKLAKIQLSKLSGSSAPGGAALFVSDSGDANFVVPDNMAAYIVTGVSGNTLVTEQLDNIPMQVPVLLVSTIDANGFLVQTKDSPTAPSGTNLLVESAGTSFGTAEVYLLYNGEFVLNAAGTVPAGKIYLPKAAIVDGGAPSPARLFIMWDEPTGIENSQLSTLNYQRSTGTWYTLDGRKLNGIPTQKGIYIVRSAEGRLQGKNGKKVVIK